MAAGVVAKKMLADLTILDETPCNEVNAAIVELGGMSDPEAWPGAIDEAVKEGDSLGAIVECTVPNIDPGYGEPFWDSVESQIAHAVFAIPGVRAIEFGDGFAVATMRGSENNDPYSLGGGQVKTDTNHSGGILGGISTGMPLVFRAAFKPTPSISMEQDTISISRKENDKLAVTGRHDPCIVPRAVPVVEAAVAVAILDLLCRM